MIVYAERIEMAQRMDQIIDIWSALSATSRNDARSIVNRHPPGVTGMRTVGDKRECTAATVGR